MKTAVRKRTIKAVKEEVRINYTAGEIADDPELKKKLSGQVFKCDTTPIRVDGWGNCHLTHGDIELETIAAGSARGVAGLRLMTGTSILTGMRVNQYVAASMKMELQEDTRTEDIKRSRKVANRLVTEIQRNTVGSDPELFAVDEKGELVPAFEFLPSAKQKSDPTTPFWDGYQAEYNTAPHVCLGWATDSFQSGLSRTLMALRKKHPKGNLSVKTVMDIPPERLATDHPKYVNFGCTPSLSVYGETFPEIRAADVPFRTAGGHMHFSWTKDVPKAIKKLDSVLAVICVSLFQRYDEPRRRMFYGRAGEYRLTGYGFEYRTLSNAWLIQPGIMNFVYEAARRILCSDLSKEWVVTEEEVRKCVNECDVKLAHEIMHRNSIGLMGLLYSMPNATHETAMAFKDVIFNGVHTVLRNPDKYSASWRLETGDWHTHGDGPSGNYTTSTRCLVNTKYLD